MRIRTRLTLQFAAIVAGILLISLSAIYLASASFRESEFYGRLRDKANSTAELLIKVQEVSTDLLKIIDNRKKDVLVNENITVYNYANQQVYTNNDTVDFHTSSQELNQVRLEGEQQKQLGEYEIIGIPYKVNNERFVVIAGAIDRFGLNKLANLRRILFIVFFAGLGAAAAAGWIYAGRALKPINTIVTQVKNISANNLNARLDEGNHVDEIAQLSATFNAMLARIENAFLLQKTFVANASHELKNPLTMITAQLEVALLRSRDPEEYRKTLDSVLEDIRNLNSIALRLLDLARLGSEEIKVEFVLTRVDELLWQCRDHLAAINPSCSVLFDLQLPEDERKLLVSGNDYLLRTAFTNLMENACKFSPDRQVSVSLAVRNDHLYLYFEDHGVGISPEDLPHIFQPFYRGRNTGEAGGHGIGLSLVERIFQLHGASIEVRSQLESGSTFIIGLPIAPALASAL